MAGRRSSGAVAPSVINETPCISCHATNQTAPFTCNVELTRLTGRKYRVRSFGRLVPHFLQGGGALGALGGLQRSNTDCKRCAPPQKSLNPPLSNLPRHHPISVINHHLAPLHFISSPIRLSLPRQSLKSSLRLFDSLLRPPQAFLQHQAPTILRLRRSAVVTLRVSRIPRLSILVPDGGPLPAAATPI